MRSNDVRDGIPLRHLKVVGDPPTVDVAQTEATASPPPAQAEHPTTGGVDQTPAAGKLSPLAAGCTDDPFLASTLLVLDALDEVFANARSGR